MSALVVFASPAAAEPQLSVEVGYAGQYLPGRSFPVRITIDADRLVRGTLTVKNAAPVSSTDITSTLPVEVAAGSKKTFVVVLASSPFFGNHDGATVDLDAGGLHLKRSATSTFQADVELVGVLPELFARSAPPATTVLSIEAGTARIVALDELALGAPGALDPLDIIVTDERSWSAVAAAGRASIVSWIASGGRLMVEAPEGTALDGLPTAWRPDATRRTVADAGEVVLTGATGRPWWGRLEPTPTRAWSEDAQLNENGNLGIPVSNTVAGDAGVRLARIGWLTGFLLVYLVVVGPGVYLVLRRKHRSGYLWAVVPAIAAVFTVGAWAAGRSLHSSSRSAHATVVMQGAAGGSATTWLGRASSHGGTAVVALPDGWGLSGEADMGGGSSRTGAQVVEGANGREVRQSLPAGGFTMVKAAGPMQLDGGFVVQATSTSDGQVKGTVRNAGKVALDDVAVFAGHAATNVGSLAPGGSSPFEITAADTDQVGQPLEMVAWPNAAGFGPVDQSGSLVTVGAIAELAQAQGSNFRALGRVQAIGWTHDLHPPLLGGALIGRTALVASAMVQADGGPSDMAILRNVLRAPGIASNGPDQQAVFAFTLPTGTATDALSLRASLSLGNVEIWTGSGWQSVFSALAPVAGSAGDTGTTSPSTTAVGPVGAIAAPPPPGFAIATVAAGKFGGGQFGQFGTSGPAGSVTVPASAFVDGRLFVRTTVSNAPSFLLTAVTISGVRP